MHQFFSRVITGGLLICLLFSILPLAPAQAASFSSFWIMPSEHTPATQAVYRFTMTLSRSIPPSSTIELAMSEEYAWPVNQSSNDFEVYIDDIAWAIAGASPTATQFGIADGGDTTTMIASPTSTTIPSGSVLTILVGLNQTYSNPTTEGVYAGSVHIRDGSANLLMNGASPILVQDTSVTGTVGSDESEEEGGGDDGGGEEEEEEDEPERDVDASDGDNPAPPGDEDEDEDTESESGGDDEDSEGEEDSNDAVDEDDGSSDDDEDADDEGEDDEDGGGTGTDPGSESDTDTDGESPVDTCEADINNDGTVDEVDASYVIFAMQSGASMDINGDASTDARDLTCVTRSWSGNEIPERGYPIVAGPAADETEIAGVRLMNPRIQYTAPVVDEDLQIYSLLDTGLEGVAVGYFRMTYPPERLRYDGAQVQNSQLNLWVQTPIEVSPGEIYFAGAFVPGFIGSDGFLGSFDFTRIREGEVEIQAEITEAYSYNGEIYELYGDRYAELIGVREVAEVPPVDAYSPSHPNSAQWISDGTVLFDWTQDEAHLQGDRYYYRFVDTPSLPDSLHTSPWASNGYQQFTQEELTDGEWWFHVQRERDGLVSDITTHRVRVDTTPPEPFTPSVSPMASIIRGYADSQMIVFLANDVTSGVSYYRIEQGDTLTILHQGPHVVSFHEPGHYFYRVAAVDKAGNQREYTVAVSVIIDGEDESVILMLVILLLLTIIIWLLYRLFMPLRKTQDLFLDCAPMHRNPHEKLRSE